MATWAVPVLPASVYPGMLTSDAVPPGASTPSSICRSLAALAELITRRPAGSDTGVSP